MSKNLKYNIILSEDSTPTNFHLDTGLKLAFKIECARNKTPMSKVVHTLIESYIIQSKKMHDKADKQ